MDAQRFRLPESEVTLARQRLRRELGIADDRPLLLFCGKLSPVKAPGLLVSAYARLRRQGTEAALLLCGDGALRSELQSQVARDAADHALVARKGITVKVIGADAARPPAPTSCGHAKRPAFSRRAAHHTPKPSCTSSLMRVARALANR